MSNRHAGYLIEMDFDVSEEVFGDKFVELLRRIKGVKSVRPITPDEFHEATPVMYVNIITGRRDEQWADRLRSVIDDMKDTPVPGR